MSVTEAPSRAVPGSEMTPLDPSNVGFAARLVQAARYAITGVSPSTWFGPMQPLQPMAPRGSDRVRDYETGWNLNYVPRSYEPITFDMLRALSYNCDVLRVVIEAVKDQMAALDWVIRPREASTSFPTPGRPSIPRASLKKLATGDKDQDLRIGKITDFFLYPDKEHSWDQWQREILEDNLVIDAPTVVRRPDRKGRVWALEVFDGATISPKIDARGRRPLPPDVAYQQILHGIPAVDFTSQEMLYLPQNVRSNKVYGYSRVEQIVVTVNIAIRRAMHQLEFYREGSTPDSFVGLPKEWNLDNVKNFQTWFDSLMSGNLGQRRRVRFMPGEFKYQETKPIDLKDMYDEWLARVICFALSVSPEPFVQHVNRQTAQVSKSRALEEGLTPRMRFIKAMMDRFVREDFASPDLEFVYLEEREQDPSAQANIDVAYAKAGIYAIDEIRQSRGRDPLGGAYATPMLATAQGYIAPGQLTSQFGNGADPQSTGNEDAPIENDGTAVKPNQPGEKPPPSASSSRHVSEG